MASHPVALRPDAMSVGATVRALLNVFKLRIGLAIMLCALAGIAVTPGPALEGWQVAATYGSAGTWHLPGTYVLVGIFFTAFALYYFVNWKYLSTVWPLQ